ncbi:hypothetical protein CCO03_18680 [Comamonas serinivorans]|uniref:Uncharacterized protein n=1 Tax=Comamonas serinivorans TaxID=1082851 RepID=A0A1Y0ERW9_9BURK|nr:hypothetical protein [Comamonas serinivorans]ARU06415.1 hypothetical protein CCO03_18680 [Comamonas serinivorans]
MQSLVRITQDEHTEWRFELDHLPAMANAEARAWLDAQFTALDCEPLRPTGKLLLVDKVLVVARDAGARRLDDPEWGPTFARAASATLGRPLVHIDLAAMTVSY